MKLKENRKLLIIVILIVFLSLISAFYLYKKANIFQKRQAKFSPLPASEEVVVDNQPPALQPRELNIPGQKKAEKSTTLYLSSDNDFCLIDNVCSVDVMVSSPNEIIDGVEFVLNFDPELVNIDQVNDGDFFSLYPQKNIDNVYGTLRVIALQEPDESKVLSDEKIVSFEVKPKKKGSLRFDFSFEKTHVAGYGGQELLQKADSWVLTIN